MRLNKSIVVLFLGCAQACASDSEVRVSGNPSKNPPEISTIATNDSHLWEMVPNDGMASKASSSVAPILQETNRRHSSFDELSTGAHLTRTTGNAIRARDKSPLQSDSEITASPVNAPYKNLNILRETDSANQEFSVIAYHRVGPDRGTYTVSRAAFVQQIQYLKEAQYSVVSLQQVFDFLDHGIALPSKAILITVDDGHKSSYTEIFPVLKSFHYSAVYFPYSDYVDYGGVTTGMMREMRASGLAEFQHHSKSHAALTQRFDEETQDAYRARVLEELTAPFSKFHKILDLTPRAIAYPYGKVNRFVESEALAVKLDTGFTVNCARNSLETKRTRLNRCTIVNADTLESFQAKLGRAVYAKGGARRSSVENDKVASLPVPEFLGNIANREFVSNVPIQPFSGYFLDAGGTGLKFHASELPSGLQIDKNSGIVSGIPRDNAGNWKIKITATDAHGRNAYSNDFAVVVY